MSLLVIFYFMALRVAEGFAKAEATPRRKSIRDLPATQSNYAEKIVGGRSRYSGISMLTAESANA